VILFKTNIIECKNLNQMKIFKTLSLFLIIASCNAPQAVYDYDQKVQFVGIDTYQIYPDLVSRLSQLDEQRLLSILSSQMATKGFATAENPEIYVNFYSSEYEAPSRSNVGIGIGGGGGNMGVGVSGGFPIGGNETYLRLTLDFIDAKNDSLIWQAIVESSFNKNASPQDRESQLKAIVDKALKGYPPKK
jgi:hypothetical protein